MEGRLLSGYRGCTDAAVDGTRSAPLRRVCGPVLTCSVARWMICFGLLVLAAGCVAAGHLEDARRAHGAGDLEEAIRLYRFASDSADWTVVRDARFGIASCLLAQGKHDSAVTEFVDYVARYPDGGGAVLAYIHAGNARMEQGDVDAADRLYKQAAARASFGGGDTLWQGWAELGNGRILTARKEYEGAVPHLLRAVSLASEPRITEIARECLKVCVDGF